MNSLKLFFKGLLMGIANIIPGVSGGTLAVVLNVFDDLIFSINNIFKDFKKSVTFLIPLFIGIMFGIVAFSSLIKYGLTNYSFATNMFFVGLVFGSIPLIYGKATEIKHSKYNFIYSLVAFAFIIWLSSISEPVDMNKKIIFTHALYLKFFFGGVVASAAMIIPGISGSFLLMIMGIYGAIIGSISAFTNFLSDFTNITILVYSLKIIIPVGFGVLIGIIVVTKFISSVLKHAYSQTYFTVLGLILGSIYSIFASSLTYSSGFHFYGIMSGVVFFVIGLFLALILGK